MVKLAEAFSRLKAFNALVIGDFMLDKYTSGSVTRISPEAPVAVVKVKEEKFLPGGAGNVVLNLRALHANVYVIGRVGSDESGKILRKKLQEEKVDVRYLLSQRNYKTPLKNRLLANGQQLVRIDQENQEELSLSLQKKIIKNLESLLEGIDIVAISDYDKGFLEEPFLQKIIGLIVKKKIPIIVDPKGDDYTKYRGVNLIKPNLQEVYFAAKSSLQKPLEELISFLKKQTKIPEFLITLSENGMAYFGKEKPRKDFPVQVKEVKDVTGAGDTVLALLCACLANQINIDQAIELANIAAGIAIEKIGCARVTLLQLAKRLLEKDVKNKIFDAEHMFALKHMLYNTHFITISLDTRKKIGISLLRTIKEIKQSFEKIIIYITDEKPDNEAIGLLSSLNEVNYIVFSGKEKMPFFLQECIYEKPLLFS